MQQGVSSTPKASLVLQLATLGGFLAVLYVGVLVLSRDFVYGEGHRGRPIVEVLSLLTTATVLYLLALWRVSKLTERSQEESKSCRLILLFAVLFRGILLFSSPIQEIDYYRYLWDGQVLAHGTNPYRYAPLEVDQRGPNAEADSDVGQLWILAQSSAALHTIFQRVHHRQVPTVYPPFAQVVFAAASWITPRSATLAEHLLILNCLFLAFDLGSILVLIAVLGQLKWKTSWCVVYAWSPLVLKEIANSAHLDTIAVFFTLLTVWALLKVRSTGVSPRGDFLWSCAALMFLGMGVLAKSYPVILLPVVLAYLFARLGRRTLVATVGFVLVLVVGYGPFWWNSAKAEPTSQHPLRGLHTFLTRWQMNDLAFMIVHENLRQPLEEEGHWFVVVPKTWRVSLHARWLEDARNRLGISPKVDPAFVLTQALMGAVVLGLSVWWAWCVYRRAEPRELLRCIFLTLVWGWLLSSTQNPWYLLWCLPFLVFVDRRSWYLLPSFALLYYLRFWYEYQALQSAEAMERARATFDFGVVWWEFGLFFVLLFVETLYRRGSLPSRRQCPLPSEGVGGAC